MIRRGHGSDFLLITQHDHALIAGELAEAVGNDEFSAPVPLVPTITGIKLHDCGWPLHDDEPTLNADQLPLDVFETPREIAFNVWTASVERTTKKDAYAGLLVSLHVLSLSVIATEFVKPHAHFDLENPQDRFAVIKFQQRELERQETLRAELGLRSEKGAHHAVVREIPQEMEDQLKFNFALLQVMDQISLAVCCTEPPMTSTRDLPTRPGGSRVKLSLARNGNDVLVTPWPFLPPQVELMIPVSRVPGKKYKDVAEFRAAYGEAPAEIITAIVRPG